MSIFTNILDRSVRFFPIRMRFALRLLALQMCVLILWRIAFGVYFYTGQGQDLTFSNISKAFWLGMRFDLRFAIVTILPFLILGRIPWIDAAKNAFARRFWQVLYTVCFFLMAVIYLGDFGNYAYLNSRVNANFLEFLQNPWINTKFVWQTYPVVWLTMATIAMVGVYWWLLERFVLSIFTANSAKTSPSTIPAKVVFWLRKVVVGGVLWLILLMFIYGSVGRYSLRWSNAFFTPNPYISALALNPILFFVGTLDDKNALYDEEAAREAYPLVAKFLGIPKEKQVPLQFLRSYAPKAKFPTSPNIVVILTESLAYNVLAVSKNPIQAMPILDALLPKSIVFHRFFTPNVQTARSVFTFMTGIPDTEVANTSHSRNPLVVRQHVILSEFKNYDLVYFIGGSKKWGNIGGIIQGNAPRVTMYQGDDMNLPRVDLWGISDLDLLLESNRVLRKRERPFFAIIQTASTHRPYTIPKRNMGFKTETLSQKTLLDSSYHSNAKYNSYRFLDFSFGKFFETARKEAYFNNTIFVIFGDHGYPALHENAPEGSSALGWSYRHVPLIIYAPGIIKQGRAVDTPASELDVMPTLAGMVGVPYRTRTLGRDLFAIENAQEEHFALITNPSKVRDGGLVGKRFFLRLHPTQKVTLHDTRADAWDRDVSAQYPEITKKMSALNRALLETANYLAWHNPPLPPR